MHIHYRKISVKFQKSFQLLPWQLNLNRSAGCNLDPFFLNLCWNSAFQYSSVSFCSENKNISQSAARGFVWHYGQFLSIVVVHTSWTRLDEGRTGLLFSSSALELLMKLVIPSVHTEEQVWKFYLYVSNYVTELYYFCLYSLCMLSSTHAVFYFILKKIKMEVSQYGLSWSCWCTGGCTLAFSFSFNHQIRNWNHLKAALNWVQVQESK